MMMEDHLFWGMIGSSSSVTIPTDQLERRLAQLSSDEIVEFYCTLRIKMAEACTPSIMCASLMIRSYLSDDDFQDFRAWLVFQGQTRYQNAVRNVESIAEWLPQGDIAKMNCTECMALVGKAYQKYGESSELIDKFFSSSEYRSDPPLPMDSLSSIRNIRNQFPMLAKYWNAEKARLYFGC